MAIQIIGSNINMWGHAGGFESDPTTWGGADPMRVVVGVGNVATLFRNNTYKTKGLYAARSHAYGKASGNRCRAMTAVSKDKKYIATAKVRTNTANKWGSDQISVRLQFTSGQTYGNSIAHTAKTVADIIDDWQEITFQFNTTQNTTVIIDLVDELNGGSHNDSLNQYLWIDEFYIREYIDLPDPDPDPDPDPGEGEGEDPDPDPDPDPEPEPTLEQVYFAKNPITVVRAATSGWELLDNYRVYCEVVVNNSTIIRMRLVPSGNSVTFYLHAALERMVHPQNIQPPAHNTAVVERITDRSIVFKIKTGNITGDQTTPFTTVESPPMLLLYGGLSKEKFASIDFFGSLLPSLKKFMTWAPTTKVVDLAQEDYLTFFIRSSAITIIKVKAFITYDDDSTDTVILSTQTGCVFGELYQLPVGPTHSGIIAINPEKNISTYVITLLNQADEVITEERTYVVNHYKHPYTRYYLFLNSLGGYEVLRFTGATREASSIDRGFVQKFLPHNYTATDGELHNNSNYIRSERSASSGYLTDGDTEAWLDYLKDFMISPRIFDITNGKRKRVVITTNSMPGLEQGNYERVVRFTEVDVYSDNSYTPSVV